MGRNNKEISGAFPFGSKYLDINGSKIHYIDEGDGDPILFLQGNPFVLFMDEYRSIYATIGKIYSP